MASLDFYNPYNEALISNSGLGFYGAGAFGNSVAVGAYQRLSYVTNSGGTTQGAQANNVKWVHANSGELNGDPVYLNLQNIPNYQSTLNMRFTHGSAVNVQNAKFRISSRADINAAASGVQVWVAEIIHPSPSQVVTGSGDASWTAPSGSGVVISLLDSPGTSGTNATGASNAQTRHDWYLVISASPNTVGSKYFLAYGSVEYY